MSRYWGPLACRADPYISAYFQVRSLHVCFPLLSQRGNKGMQRRACGSADSTQQSPSRTLWHLHVLVFTVHLKGALLMQPTPSSTLHTFTFSAPPQSAGTCISAIPPGALCALLLLRSTQVAFTEPFNIHHSQPTWLARWERPNCWMALSALQGSSSVRCTRRRWLAARLRAVAGRGSGRLLGDSYTASYSSQPGRSSA
jgi:hypothetical protein